jgi:indolepyruvate ferredoxin oxidoreductase alpha subunit
MHGRRIHGRGDAERTGGVCWANMRPDRHHGPARSTARALATVLRETARRRAGRAWCRRARPTSAPAAPSGRCSRRSSWWSSEIGKLHVSADIGCHSFATFEPFSFGHSILGYGMSMASSAAVKNFSANGGRGHHGRRRLLAQRPAVGRLVGAAEQGRRRAGHHEERLHLGHRHAGDDFHARRRRAARVAEGRSATGNELTIEKTLAGMGVKWLRTVHNYRMASVRDTLREALTSPFTGLKVIDRRGRMPARAPAPPAPAARGPARRKAGTRRAHPLRCRRGHLQRRPFLHPAVGLPDAHRQDRRRPAQARAGGACTPTNASAAACAARWPHAAVLCPSFYRAEVITHPGWWERLADRINRVVIGWLQPA